MQAISSLAQSLGMKPSTTASLDAANEGKLAVAAQQVTKEIGASEPTEAEKELKSAYQELVAGTFYKMMLKALRSGESDLPYIGGGQTEKLFSAQFDDLITTDLSKSHGDWFSDPLFQASQSRLSK